MGLYDDHRFGIATDVQYADIDDGFSHGGVPRFYRGALRGLQRAVAAWRAQHVEFAIHLGDIIDGCAQPDNISCLIVRINTSLCGLLRRVDADLTPGTGFAQAWECASFFDTTLAMHAHALCLCKTTHKPPRMLM